MTFSAKIKEELCKMPLKNPECVLAECCGLILFANSTKKDKIKIITENKDVAHRASWLLKSLFGFDFDKKIIPAQALKKFNLIIETPEKLEIIFESFGIDPRSSLSLRLNAAIIESDDARAAFCRGAFLSGGSITDPESAYHLELATSHNALSREVVSLLLDLDLPAKTATRKSNYVIYFKESGHIEDFLTRIGAPVSAVEFMQTKLFKNVRNQTNRQVNCDVANLNKAADAAKSHLSDIHTIIESGEFDLLSPQLQSAANLRLAYPDATLSELVAFSNGEVGKSGLNHRFSKLHSIAEEIKARKDS